MVASVCGRGRGCECVRERKWGQSRARLNQSKAKVEAKQRLKQSNAMQSKDWSKAKQRLKQSKAKQRLTHA